METKGQRSSRRRFLQASAGISLGLASGKIAGRDSGDEPQIKPADDGLTSGSAASPGHLASESTRTVTVSSASEGQGNRGFLWLKQPPRTTDLTVGFRGSITIETAEKQSIRLQVFGAHWFNLYIDGELITEGPARFDRDHPEYEELELNLAPGKHCLAAVVQSEGVSTRLLRGDIIPAFFWCRILGRGGDETKVDWKCRVLEGYIPSNVRVNPQLGWIEWCDREKNPSNWILKEFDDGGWENPATVDPKLGSLQPLSIEHVPMVSGTPKLLAHGHYTGPRELHRGSAGEDIFIGLLRRNLNAPSAKHDGVWRRYDLGQVRLFRPRFVMDLPKGTPVDFMYAETLSRGAVSPLIPLSVGSSCNFDHYVASGGEEEFFPIAPRGGRFLEVHVGETAHAVRFVREQFLERTYFTDAVGVFKCEDDLLNSIWQLGVSTLRGCTEDAVTDNPTRERGEWTGDVVTVGMDIMAAAHDDLRLIRRGLRHSAWCANEEGIIAGLCPGGTTYVSTYALQWIPAVLRYFEHTGDREFLVEMLPYARRNLAAFAKHSRNGLLAEVPGTWSFVDWGYLPKPGQPDVCLNLHYLAALQQMKRWHKLLNDDGGTRTDMQLSTTHAALQPFFTKVSNTAAVEDLGYHAAVLGFHAGLWSAEQSPTVLGVIKSHMLNSFPNDRTAPRLTNPTIQSRQLITPYFAHYAFPPLIENNEMDFVLNQYRTCWGYALEDGRTTMLEVFDPNWSHCHQWACCPTWQLSRYGLGLHPRFDLGTRNYALNLNPGTLNGARGNVPVSRGNGKPVEVSWQRNGKHIRYRIQTPEPITLHHSDSAEETVIQGTWETVIQLQ